MANSDAPRHIVLAQYRPDPSWTANLQPCEGRVGGTTLQAVRGRNIQVVVWGACRVFGGDRQALPVGHDGGKHSLAFGIGVVQGLVAGVRVGGAHGAPQPPDLVAWFGAVAGQQAGQQQVR
jgi:hypothetical protein